MQTMEAKESSQGRLGGQRRGVIWGVRTLVDSEAGGGRGYAKEGVGCGGQFTDDDRSCEKEFGGRACLGVRTLLGLPKI